MVGFPMVVLWFPYGFPKKFWPQSQIWKFLKTTVWVYLQYQVADQEFELWILQVSSNWLNVRISSEMQKTGDRVKTIIAMWRHTAKQS